MKFIVIFFLMIAFSIYSQAQSVICTGITNDKNTTENVKFELTLQRDQNPISHNSRPFYKSMIKYFYSTNTSTTGLDLTDHLSVLPQQITFFGSLSSVRNLIFNYQPDGSIQNIIMNYDSRIINQPVVCDNLDFLPIRPICKEANENTKTLIQAIKSNDLDLIETAIACGANVNFTDKNGCTPVMFAVEPTCGETNILPYDSFSDKTLNILDRLTNNGAYLNTADQKGETPLIKAVKMGIPNIYDTFIAAEADFDVQDQLGNTALMYAAYNGDDIILNQLLEGNPDRSLKNKASQTAYDIAKKWQKDSIIDLLRIPDSSVQIEGKDDGTCAPLQINLKLAQVVELSLKPTEKMFKLDSSSLGLDMMADSNTVSKRTLSFDHKGQFKFTCGFHGANKVSTGVIVVE